MKIGILTMHYQSNYGGMLQSYALYKILSNKGYDVKLIDFRETNKNSFIDIIYKIGLAFYKDVLLQRIDDIHVKRKIKRAPNPIELSRKFESFKKKYNILYTQTVHEKEIPHLICKFDCIIVGSDQVWTNLGKRQLPYLLDNCNNYGGKIISYAACSANKAIPFYNKIKLKKLLNKFHSISVRDNTTYKLISPLLNNAQPTIVADPTLLYNFNEIIKTKRIISEPYLFVYILGAEIKEGHSYIIQQMKKEYQFSKIVAVCIPNISLEGEKIADISYRDASPEQWLNLLYHAQCVYTDSFHGCMFSLKFNKGFIGYYISESRASRLIDLKKQFNLNNIIEKSSEYENISIDYKTINKKITELQSTSITFLTSSLS